MIHFNIYKRYVRGQTNLFLILYLIVYFFLFIGETKSMYGVYRFILGNLWALLHKYMYE